MNAPPPRQTRTASPILIAILASVILSAVGGSALVVRAAEEPLASVSPPPAGATDPSASSLPSTSPGPPTSDADASSADPDADRILVEELSPVVPVARFWSKRDGVSRRDAIAALEQGKLPGYKQIIVEDTVREALAAALGITISEDVKGGDATRIEQAVSKGALGFLAAIDLSPRVRALEVNGRSLVGNDRVSDISEWSLLVTRVVAAETAWGQDRTWVLVAGGDSFTDRGVYDKVVRKGKGVDYPFDGGTARVTGHGCCDPVYNDNVVPRYVLTGNKGLVRKLFRGAELAIANHEQPVTESATHHSSGTRFSGKPALTRVFTRAGIDWLSLANNHIKDFGGDGIKDTRRILRQHGIAFGGAGRDLEQSRRISYLEAGDTRVAIIPCLGIVRSYWAGPKTSGATPCLDRYLVPDIKRAKRKADVVIVFPHWGVEYTRQPLPSMRKHAARWTKAGADLVFGAHSHVAGSIEDFDGAPVLYSLGNLIFDQNWSTNTMESALLEATFHGDRLIELRLRPYIIHDTSQPNFLDPAKGEGRRLITSIRDASADWLDW